MISPDTVRDNPDVMTSCFKAGGKGHVYDDALIALLWFVVDISTAVEE